MGWLGLIIALVLKSRRAQIATLSLVLIGSVSAWPVFEFGEQGYDRVLAMTDEDGHAECGDEIPATLDGRQELKRRNRFRSTPAAHVQPR